MHQKNTPGVVSEKIVDSLLIYRWLHTMVFLVVVGIV